eukprot:2459082-Lingulodinium_polyedra.AAC.1
MERPDPRVEHRPMPVDQVLDVLDDETLRHPLDDEIERVAKQAAAAAVGHVLDAPILPGFAERLASDAGDVERE